MGTLKDRIVVELGIGKQSPDAPVLQQGLSDSYCKDHRVWPRTHKAAVEGDGIEDFYFSASSNDQTRDGVELVEFGMFCGHIGKIPATRWRGTAHTTVGIEGSVSSEDPVNGWQRRDIRGVLLEQFAADGGRAKFTEVAVVTQLLPEIQYQILHSPCHTISCPVGTGMAVMPLHSVKTRVLSSLNPPLDGEEAKTKLACHRAHRGTLAESDHYVVALLFGRTFFAILAPCSVFH